MQTAKDLHSIELDTKVENFGTEIKQNKRRDRILKYVVSAAFILNLVTLVFIYQPPNVINYLNIPFPTDKSTYVIGERVGYDVQYCKYTDAAGLISRTLVYDKGGVIAVPQVSSVTIKGCRTTRSLTFEIPQGAPNGLAHIETISEYNGLFSRKQEIHSYSANFTIVSSNTQ